MEEKFHLIPPGIQLVADNPMCYFFLIKKPPEFASVNQKGILLGTYWFGCLFTSEWRFRPYLRGSCEGLTSYNYFFFFFLFHYFLQPLSSLTLSPTSYLSLSPLSFSSISLSFFLQQLALLPPSTKLKTVDFPSPLGPAIATLLHVSHFTPHLKFLYGGVDSLICRCKFNPKFA